MKIDYGVDKTSDEIEKSKDIADRKNKLINLVFTRMNLKEGLEFFAYFYVKKTSRKNTKILIDVCIAIRNISTSFRKQCREYDEKYRQANDN